MIRFLGIRDLPEYTGSTSSKGKQLSFCLSDSSAERFKDLSVIKGLSPSSTMVEYFEHSQRTVKDEDVFRSSYRTLLDGFSALMYLNGMINMSNEGYDFNIVVNSDKIDEICVDELVEKMKSSTDDLEVLV